MPGGGAGQLRTFSRYFLNELHLCAVQLVELYAVLSALKDGEMSEDETIERLSRFPHWIWTAIGRRSATPCQSEAGLGQQLVLFQGYHNFVLPHASLRQPLAEPVPTNGTGSAKVWRPCTPAMAAGLTDHVWTLKEVLRYRVPP